MVSKSSYMLCLLWLIVFSVRLVNGQEEISCYGSGSIAISVILSIIFTTALLILGYYIWKKYKNRKENLILETDPEKGKNEYAFDNPGFKDAGLTPITKSLEKNTKSECASSNKPKWNQWSPLSALTTKSEKRKTLDDSTIDGNEVKVVALRSHDFTGLGFNICGNMKEGIFIKDVLHRGPASESGKLNPGDRINSVTISFEHMVYEDALTILSYASPYEVIIEAKGGKIIHHIAGQGAQPSHPVYRSSSCTDLFSVDSAKKKLFSEDSLSSNYSSLQKSKSNMTTLERKESKSPQVGQSTKQKKPSKLSPEQFKHQLEHRILLEPKNQVSSVAKIENEVVQKHENNKYQKFGIRVLPSEKSPKSELSQNDNNINLERQPLGIDEVDDKKPQAKKRERKPEITANGGEGFNRNSSINGSGIKRDENGIPQEIPNFMMNAAVSARKNRRGSSDRGLETNQDDDSQIDKTPKRTKGKAPAPPPESKINFDEIQSVDEDFELIPSPPVKRIITTIDMDEELEVVELRVKPFKNYNSDSDIEPDNQSSVNTIELNSSDITIHHAEVENDSDDRQNRKTASTGDLTKIQKTRKSSGGTLERAQSLDITDAGIPTLTKKRKGGRIEDVFDSQSDEDLFGKALVNKEPRLSLILDGLNTFQRNRLKKSTEWGNLEDAILKLNQEDQENNSPEVYNQNISLENMKFDFGDKSEEFDALVNKINEIKRESMDMSGINEELSPQITPVKEKKNQIWPFDDSPILVKNEEKSTTITVESPQVLELQQENSMVHQAHPADRRQRKPAILEEPKDEPPLPPASSMIEEKIIPKFDLPEKNDYLLESRLISKQIYPPSAADDEEKIEEKWEIEEVVRNKSDDEIKTNSTYPPYGGEQLAYINLVDLTKNFIFTERLSCGEDDDYITKSGDTNISDDIKVSRHSLGSLERPKCDDAKSIESKLNISNVTINDNDSNNLSLDLIADDTRGQYKTEELSELYTTALDKTIIPPETKQPDINNDSKVIITTPDIIKNVTITEAINTLNNDVTIHGPSSLTLEIPRPPPIVEVTGNQYSKLVDNNVINHSIATLDENSDDSPNKSSLTYITEIQVLTPNNSNSNSTNISEIEIIPNINNNTNSRNLDNEFENYVKNFESNVKNFETNIQKFENHLPPKTDKNITIETIDPEKELHKIQEIAEEQLKKLPEMRFTTASYESPKTPSEKRSTQQIDLLRSNFEKSPPKSNSKSEMTKSRIPIATTTKTPPTSPERRDSKNLDMENDKDILELMSSNVVHSTPFQSKIKPPSSTKNVTVTSIRNNSKIPSGLPVLGGNRPPIPPRKYQDDNNMVQVSTNGGVESSFKQWVFNPSDNSVTNIVVSESKQQK